MADLYSIIAGIQPDQQDIVEAELLAKQILEANFPDMDLREGTGVRDLLLRPASFLLALCKKGFDYHFDQNTLANITDTSPTELVDSLLGNLFLTRNLGTQAKINVRLYFARQKAITLTTSTSFSTDGVLLFFPEESSTYAASAMLFDSFQNEYYLDVDLLASEKGANYNLSSGSLLYFSNFDPYFLHGEINYLSQSSISPETNTQFISRAQTSISTRNLINKPSIDNVLRQKFNFLNRVVTIGAGDAEIFRDQVEVTGSVGEGVLGTAMALADGDLNLLITMPAHGLIPGQLINIDESGPGPSLLSIKRQPISTVIDVNSFKIVLPITVAPRVFAEPIIARVEEDIFVHQGGTVDVHCGDAISTKLAQFTLDSTGKCTIQGPYFKVARSEVADGPVPDTVPLMSSFTTLFSGHATRADISLVQGIDDVLTLTIPSHPLVVGRMVEISGWPSLASKLYLTVTQVLDSDRVILGSNLPTYVVGSGLSPILRYVYPSKDTGFSDRQDLILDFGSGQANGVATMVLSYFSNVDSVQGYLDLSENRVICADLLARGYDLYILDIDLKVYDLVAPASGEVFSIIDTFLKKLTPGDELILADLVADLTANGISKLKTPVGVTYHQYTKDMMPVQTGIITDALKPLNSVSIFTIGSVTTGIESV